MEEKKKHAGGAPTKYKSEYCKEMIEYFRVEPTQAMYKKEYFSNGNLKSEVPIVVASNIPTFQGFADKINVNMDTLTEWRKKHAEFSVAYNRCKELQEKIWLENAMNGRYNAQFAIFFGKNCLGYKDKQEIENSGNIDVKIEGYNPDYAK